MRMARLPAGGHVSDDVLEQDEQVLEQEVACCRYALLHLLFQSCQPLLPAGLLQGSHLLLIQLYLEDLGGNLTELSPAMPRALDEVLTTTARSAGSNIAL